MLPPDLPPRAPGKAAAWPPAAPQGALAAVGQLACAAHRGSAAVSRVLPVELLLRAAGRVGAGAQTSWGALIPDATGKERLRGAVVCGRCRGSVGVALVVRAEPLAKLTASRPVVAGVELEAWTRSGASRARKAGAARPVVLPVFPAEPPLGEGMAARRLRGEVTQVPAVVRARALVGVGRGRVGDRRSGRRGGGRGSRSGATGRSRYGRPNSARGPSTLDLGTTQVVCSPEPRLP